MKYKIAAMTTAAWVLTMIGACQQEPSPSVSRCTDSTAPGESASKPDAKTQNGWIPLFNGKDLSGWEAMGGAKWTVEDGCIVGVQGKNNAEGDLLTKAACNDFVLTCTYRVEWPCNSGIWFRYKSADQSYQADILEIDNERIYSGSLYCPGKRFLATNPDKKLENRTGWNQLKVRAKGDHIRVWLNDRQIADVHDDTSDSGKIGIQIHQGDHFGTMKIVVRDIRLKPLG